MLSLDHIPRQTRLSMMLFVGVLATDIITKQWILALLDWGMAIAIAPHLQLVLVLNPGVSFGMAADWNIPYWLFGSFAGIVGIALLVWAQKHHDPWQSVAITLISSGACGNAIDRFAYGAVVDFIDVELWAGYHWPAFNVADAAISCGAVLYILREIKGSKTTT